MAASPERTLRLDAFVPFRLSYTSNLVSGRVATAYARQFGLSIPEWRVLAVVAETAGLTQQAIVGRTRMDKVTVSRATLALVERGLIRRAENPADRRSRLLALTAEGRALYAQVAPRALDLEAQLFSAFDADELARFVAMLRRIDAVALADAVD